LYNKFKNRKLCEQFSILNVILKKKNKIYLLNYIHLKKIMSLNLIWLNDLSKSLNLNGTTPIELCRNIACLLKIDESNIILWTIYHNLLEDKIKNKSLETLTMNYNIPIYVATSKKQIIKYDDKNKSVYYLNISNNFNYKISTNLINYELDESHVIYYNGKPWSNDLEFISCPEELIFTYVLKSSYRLVHFEFEHFTNMNVKYTKDIYVSIHNTCSMWLNYFKINNYPLSNIPDLLQIWYKNKNLLMKHTDTLESFNTKEDEIINITLNWIPCNWDTGILFILK
jgi:hypothetical protein